MSRASPCRAAMTTMTDAPGVTPRRALFQEYAPEVLFGLMILVRNIALIAASAWTITTLYQMSGSWHCLWPLLMLFGMGQVKFVRD